MCNQNVFVTGHRQLCKTLPSSKTILWVLHCILCTQVWSLGVCWRASRSTVLGAAPHTAILLHGAWEGKVSCHRYWNRILIYGHHKFIIHILVLLISCTHSSDRLLCLVCYQGRLCLWGSVPYVMCVCVFQWLVDDGQAGLTAEIQIFCDVAVWGWFSSSNVCKVLKVEWIAWPWRWRHCDPSKCQEMLANETEPHIRTLGSLQCHCETLQCIFLCTADSRYSGSRSSSAAQQWSAGSWNKRMWLCSITWRISWGITMYWWRNRPWMQYSNPSVISRSSYRNCRTWGITCSLVVVVVLLPSSSLRWMDGQT